MSFETDVCPICGGKFRKRSRLHIVCHPDCNKERQRRKREALRKKHGSKAGGNVKPYMPTIEQIERERDKIAATKMRDCPRRLSCAYQGATPDRSRTANFVHPVDPDPDERVDCEIL